MNWRMLVVSLGVAHHAGRATATPDLLARSVVFERA
jgi:hypothetical protein